MAETSMPRELVEWMRARRWGDHHVEWHATRQWDVMSAGERAAAIRAGWRRAAVQEGQPGNGREFLVMHRAMLELLRVAFPQHVQLLSGWTTPPTNPDDPVDPVPAGNPRAFDPDKLNGVRAIEGSPQRFLDDDSFGLFVETSVRPTASNPRARSTDKRTGVHNYLHNRFSVAGSAIDMGDPRVNLENQWFWRLHGWIDAKWTTFRVATGRDPNDSALRSDIDAAKQHLNMTAGHAHHGMALLALSSSGAPLNLPASIARPFAPSLARQFEAHMAAAAPLDDRDALVTSLGIAARLEWSTIPLYLTAWWSLNTQGDPNASVPAKVLQDVVMEEMLHMGLVCNILAGIGETPDFATPESAPRYPDVLPGIAAARPFALEAFSLEQVERFLEIERPEAGPIPDIHLMSAGVSFPTIGAFYTDLTARLRAVNPTFSTTRQVKLRVGAVTKPPITSVDEAVQAITFIKEQGEGTAQSRTAPSAGGELAHYYKFNQIVRKMEYVRQPDGSWELDPSKPLIPPGPAGVRPMAPVPAGGYTALPEAVQFDELYSDMVRTLQSSWTGGGQRALGSAQAAMIGLVDPAIELMSKPRQAPFSGGNYAPDFVFLPPAAPPAAPGPQAGAVIGRERQPRNMPMAGSARTVPSFARIRDILDAAVNGNDIGAHGAFWRGVTRDQFVAVAPFGKPLLARRADGSFDPQESNLVKALEGRAPFGMNLNPRPPGARFNRMPDGYPPVLQAQIDEIRAWITAGCPDQAPSPPAPAARLDALTVGTLTDADHVAFWREFDNFFMFHVTPATRADIGTYFTAADAFLDYCLDSTRLPAWTAALAPQSVAEAIGRLEAEQRSIVVAHYGQSPSAAGLLDSFEGFGAGQLPPDPLRPGDPHQMNGESMWAIWAGFCDALGRIPRNSPASAGFWILMARGILLGMLSDGVVRGRFRVNGFSNDPAGRRALRTFVEGIADQALSTEIVKRIAESGMLG